MITGRDRDEFIGRFLAEARRKATGDSEKLLAGYTPCPPDLRWGSVFVFVHRFGLMRVAARVLGVTLRLNTQSV